MFKNDQELNLALLKDFRDMLDKVAAEILQKIVDSIDKEVYGAGTPSSNGYQRNKLQGGLSGSFEKTKATIQGQQIESTIDQNPMSMVHDPDNYVHGSNDWSSDDIRDILADMIIAGGDDSVHPHVGPRFGSGFWTRPRDFWTPILTDLQNGVYDKFIESEMTQRGIVWKKI